MTKSNHKSDSDINRIYQSDMTIERQFLRDVILYGCYNSGDYQKRQGLFHFSTSERTDGNLTKSALNFEKRRLRVFLPENTLIQDEHGNYVFRYDASKGNEHPLLFSYCMESCRMLYTSAFIQIQSYLNKQGQTKKAVIYNDLKGYLDKDEGSQKGREKVDISQDGVNHYLDLLTDAGFLKNDGDVYAEADDVLEGFTVRELRRILRALDFAINTSSFCAPYYFAWRKLRLYLPLKKNEEAWKRYKTKKERKDKNAKKPDQPLISLIKDDRLRNTYIDFPRRHIFSQLDQDQIYLILCAIHDKKLIRIDLFNRDRYGSEETEIITKVVLPVRIREDAWTGRMLVQCINPEDSSLHQYRIDYINRVELVEPRDDEMGDSEDDMESDEKKDVYQKKPIAILFDYAGFAFDLSQNYIWSTSENISEPVNYCDFTKVKVRFHVSEDTQYVIDRVELEMLNGEGRQLDENTYEYVFEATDPNDMSAWLRSFGESVEVLEPFSLRNRIRKQWTNAEEQMNGEKEFLIDQNENYFNGNDSLKREDSVKKKDDDITIAPPYENIRNEVMTAIWYTAFRQKEKSESNDQEYHIGEYLIDEACGNLALKNSKLKDYLDVRQLMYDDPEHDEMPPGYLLKKGNYDDWLLNTTEVNFYGDMPVRLSKLEREGLVALLRQEDTCKPLLGERLFNKLKEAIGDQDLQWDPENIVLKQNWGSYESGKPDWDKIIKLRDAIEKIECITFHYQPVFSDKYDVSQEQKGYPVRLEYFPGGNRVRVVMYMEEEKKFTYMMVERMSDIRIGSNIHKKIREDKYNEFIRENERQLVMEIKPVGFALERIVRLFSYYQKEMVCDRRTSIYTMTLTYLKQDEEAIVRDILSCGDFVKVKGNPQLRDKVLKRIQSARNNYQ